LENDYLPFIDNRPALNPLGRLDVNPGFTVNPQPKELSTLDAFKQAPGAAYATENVIVNGIKSLMNFEDYGPLDDEHNPLEGIMGTEFEPYADSFVGSRNQLETDAIKEGLREEVEARRILQESGGVGTGFAMLAGFTDITTLLPLGGLVKGTRAGVGVGRSALTVGGLSAVDATISEGLLHSMQETRTLEESLFNVGGSFVLGSVIGTGIPIYKNYKANRQIQELATHLENESKVPESSADDVFGEGGLQKALEAQSVGAARVRDKDNILKDTLNVDKAVNYQDPVLRSVTSPFKSVRDAITRLTEQSLEFKQNDDFVATGPQGGSVEGRIKTQGTARLYKAITSLDEQFKAYYFGEGKKKRAAAIRSEANRRLKGDQRLTWAEFKQEVAKSLRRGDTHEIPEVQKAAQDIRKDLFEPIKEDAINQKLLPEDVETDTAPSYLTRSYDKGKIVAERPQFREMLVDYLEGGQSVVQKEIDALDLEIARLKEQDADVIGEPIKPQDPLETFFDARLDREPRDGFEGATSAKLLLDEFNKFAQIQGFPKINEEQLTEFLRSQGVGVLMKGGQLRFRTFLKGPKPGESPEISAGEFQSIRADNDDPKSFIEGKFAEGGDDKFFNDVQKRFASETSLGRAANDVDEALGARIQREQRIGEIATRLEELNAKLRTQPDDLRAYSILTREDLGHIADEVIDTILGSPGGRTLYKTHAGPLHERTLKIPDLFIDKRGQKFESYLENDVERVMRYYTRTMVPEIEITREFGDLELSRATQKIKDEATAIAERTPQDKRGKVYEKANSHIRDLQNISDRLRGLYGLPEDPTAFAPRAIRTVKQINLLRLLGGMTLSAIPDVFRLMMVHGAPRQLDSMFRMVKNMKAVKLSFEEAKLAGTAADMVLDTRVAAIADIGEEFSSLNRFEKGVDALTSQFGVISLMAPWNAFVKQWAGLVTQSRLLEMVSQLKAGRSLPKKEINKLASGGIDEGTALRIAEQFDKHGRIEDGVYIANTNAWDDRIAKDAFRSAVVRDIDRIIVTPGQDRPLFASQQFGSLVLQFKSFAISSVQRTLMSSLQQRDMAVLMGLFGSLGAGVVVEYLKAFVNDKPLPKTADQWVIAAIDRAGVTGWLFDANHLLERVTRGNIGFSAVTGKTVSRYASRNIADAILGPSAGLMKDISSSIGATFDGEFSEADFRALRRTIPLQNLLYFSWLLKRYEKDIQAGLGLAPSKGFKN